MISVLHQVRCDRRYVAKRYRSVLRTPGATEMCAANIIESVRDCDAGNQLMYV
jgi:hypothetical protein